MIRSENIFLPIYPVTPNHITQKGFPAKFCSIFALSARICRFSTAAFELEYFCLSARICRFWRSFYAESDILLYIFCQSSDEGHEVTLPNEA
jgi:hypothetical protein